MPKLETFLPLMAALVLAASLSGCGKPSAQSDADPANAAPPVTHSGGKPVDPATAGSITGSIRFEGAPPQMRTINMIDVPNCAKMHSAPAMTETVVPGDSGTLQNVVVYLQGDFGAYSFPASETPVKVEQQGCIYAPHVVAVMTGDPIAVTNTDSVTHNINAVSQSRQGFNETQLPGSAPIVRRFSHEEIPMAVKCNMHPWMRFYVAVVDHPYFEVTGKDGRFALRNIPPGTYTLTAWHEAYGMKKQTIIVQPKQEQTASITFTDKDRP